MENEKSEKAEKANNDCRADFKREITGQNQPSHPKRGKMDRKQRAKQFMPFSALKGLCEALAVEELKREE